MRFAFFYFWKILVLFIKFLDFIKCHLCILLKNNCVKNSRNNLCCAVYLLSINILFLHLINLTQTPLYSELFILQSIATLFNASCLKVKYSFAEIILRFRFQIDRKDYLVRFIAFFFFFPRCCRIQWRDDCLDIMSPSIAVGTTVFHPLCRAAIVSWHFMSIEANRGHCWIPETESGVRRFIVVSIYLRDAPAAIEISRFS